MKYFIILVWFLCYSCEDKYAGEIVYKATIPPNMNGYISKTDVDVDAKTDRQAKIKFVTQATIYNNLSPHFRSQFIAGTLMKNNKRMSYVLDQNTIDSINQSIKRVTEYRNGYFSPYVQK
ncbi:hypothetical protein ACQ7CX_04140 [Chryseobacterium arthrosphaerae]|uniref:hypothetical protein n=1 Tax=Chryseobacterium arthrosphaerae TaxID=651561 RepID=UPI001BB03928|nr:hypothetical protein [Chryseobacterium arthrosphaerae]QUY57310.1 hypothetical protein I2F65_08265 [Chryseobacterium arthrosphaerae]